MPHSSNSLDDARLDKLVEEFRAHYAAHMPGHSSFFPGALEAMDRFASNGYQLAVCTNKYEEPSVKLLTSMRKPRFAASLRRRHILLAQTRPHAI